MACGACGKKPVKKATVDKRGNPLNKYAFLKPNQLAFLKAEEEKKAKENQ